MTASPIEALKAGSRHLRGSLAEELASPEPSFSKEAQTLVKFHGLYQQKDRFEKEKPPVLMLRGRIPGGRLSAGQYLAWDDLADRYGDGTLRLTSRQSIELHGVLKGDLKATLQGLHAALQTTKGACGDVVRTVTQAPNPWLRRDLAQLDAVVDRLAAHFQAVSNAYAEIWLDGERVNPEKEQERLFGATYLPRKFKFSVTVAGENLVDLYTNDVGLAATFGADRILDGFFVVAGGGMGMTHGDDTTFPRVADLLGWIPEAAAIPVAEAIVGVHRDEGSREDRKRARLKYVIARKGLPWFKAEVEARAGIRFEERPLPPWRTTPVLGWLERSDGTLALGLSIPAGRIAGRLKAALREVITTFHPGVQLSPDQDLILLGLNPEVRGEVEALFLSHGHPLEAADPLAARAMACVALPLCGLALIDAERVLPDRLADIRAALGRRGLADRSLLFRMTGCANGCARPYTAELALVGQTGKSYALFVGGDPEGTRLAFPVAHKVTVEAFPAALDHLFSAWAQEGRPGEAFGDFATRVGAQRLRPTLEEQA
ncbi:MAG: NADPH-dependent assimilatory sulfite reductase hemoprotein subunit [Geothrix sp.]|uniref:NADPH-dependent assimilatory sulfite reductase hemoprotein subunit n=1 Tax=Geothrix sp. TaxID=1962974 RepID=UPI001833B633|nr:NADPH-dependent assimilatory sulfite reductase hemoprotein subunit [Geothrix sp.]NWJ40264.1 NADPH-dependent assimilatory sulfite reductase hemoprotein subunit [Geothrix sp.]WIL21730.1 MAG: NADPH-dependent assimilatory sulfite reductase hemoprotein subunit [Geothrix sp.]